MRILFCSDYFGNYTTTFIYNPFSLLSTNHHHAVRYISLARNNINIFPSNDVSVIPFHRNKLFHKFFSFLERKGIYINYKNKDFYLELNKQVDAFDPDIIHFHFGNEAIKFLLNFKKNNLNRRIVLHFHGYDASYHIKNKAYIRFFKNLIKLNSEVRFIFCCQFLFENFRKHVNVKFDYNIIYYGVVSKFLDIHLNKLAGFNQITFLQVGSLEIRKGQRETILAFNDFLRGANSKKYQLIIAGGGSELANLENLVADLCLKDYVIFTNWVTTEEVFELLIKSDYFIHPSMTIGSQTEGLPNAIIEALAIGMPVISTYHAGIPEIITDGVNGILVEEGDHLQLVNALKKIVNWPNRLKVNKEKARTKFYIENHIKELLDVYDEMNKGFTYIKS